MSTTAPTFEVQNRDDPDEVFEKRIFTNPEICSSCFCRIKHDHVRVCSGTLGHDVEPKATRAAPVRLYETADGEIGPEGICVGSRQVEITTKARYPTRTVCSDCGSIAGRADSESMSRREALSRAETLSERLLEVGESVDVDVLKHLVGHLKSQPQFTGYDTEVFEAATTVAIRNARS
ncbi:hypothetical protein [Halopiger thermotolerans]